MPPSQAVCCQRCSELRCDGLTEEKLLIEIGIDKKSMSIFFAIGGALRMRDNGSIITKKMIRIHFFATDRVAIDIDFAFICKTY